MHIKSRRCAILLMSVAIWLVQLTGCTQNLQASPVTETSAAVVLPVSITRAVDTPVVSHSRGYLTTPQELAVIKHKADQGIEPYASAVADVLSWAAKDWNYSLDANVRCRDKDQDHPAWNDNQNGTPILYAKALAYHLTGSSKYAEEVKTILQRIMVEVKKISTTDQQCRINFSWGTPELVASADLIEDFWNTQLCTGPLGTLYDDTTIGSGNCKVLFQNWLVKNPYYIVSYSAEDSRSNWGASGTTTTAYIADYLWDRPEIKLARRNPPQINGGKDSFLSPAQAYAHANRIAIRSMNGYEVEYGSDNSCDYLDGPQQNSEMEPVKSQITEKGIITEDARREEYCNISQYNGQYQNYPQLHIGDTVQQCELMLRRGDSSCYDNVDNTDIPKHSFVDPEGVTLTTHLYPGRGSIERAIKAIIVDSNTEWKRVSALEVAYHYYYDHHKLPGFERWFDYLNGHRPGDCSQDICFGTLTHGFASGEHPSPPPTVPPPQ
jgi:hypothetical protein